MLKFNKDFVNYDSSSLQPYKDILSKEVKSLKLFLTGKNMNDNSFCYMVLHNSGFT